jgi:hypothetical protein
MIPPSPMHGTIGAGDMTSSSSSPRAHAIGAAFAPPSVQSGLPPTIDGPLSPAAYALAVLAIVGFAAYVSIVNFWFAYDDALITYRMARNFALGRGFVYNPGDWHMGTTAPLYGLILGVLGRIVGADAIPFLGGLISSLSLVLGGLALAAYGHLRRAPLAGALAGMFWVTNPMLFHTFGGEMPLQMALILWAFVAWRADRMLLSTTLLACAVLTRPDGIIAAGLVGVCDLVVRRRIVWRAWLLFAAVLAPFVLLEWWWYGSLLPGTLQAKLAQRDSGNWATYFGKGLRNWFRAFLLAGVDGPRIEFLSIDPGTLSFWTTVGLLALVAYRVWWPVLLWVGVFVMAYRTLKVPFYHWYAAPALVGLSIVTGCGVSAVVSLARRGIQRGRAARAGQTRGRRQIEGLIPVAVGAVLVGVAAYPYLASLPVTSRPPTMILVYEEVGRWLHDNTAPASSVGYYEIGFIGYYSDRRIVDSLGLIDPATPPHVAQRDYAWAFRTYRPTYILEKPGAGDLNSFRNEPWFAAEYRVRRTFTGAEDPERNQLVLYERVDATSPLALGAEIR